VDRYHEALIEFARTSGKAVIVSCGVAPDPEVHAALRAAGIPVLDDPELCLRAMGRIVRAQAATHDAPPDAGDAPSDTIYAAIEHDRDFGRVLVLRASATGPRVVRALPASREALHDAVRELVDADGMAFPALAPLVGLVHDWVAAAPAEAEAHVELTLAP
jgi:hypothetical protein